MRTVLLFILFAVLMGGCGGKRHVVMMDTTAYCGCGKCCSWERGNAKYLNCDVWNRYVSKGPSQGKTYTGHTSSGTKPHIPHPGLFSWDSVKHPWMIPIRIVFFPWLLLPSDGTLAADTKHYPFGTRMHIPGYGWGVVEDKGGAIKGPVRIDLYHWSHRGALKWGRQKLPVTIEQQ